MKRVTLLAILAMFSLPALADDVPIVNVKAMPKPKFDRIPIDERIHETKAEAELAAIEAIEIVCADNETGSYTAEQLKGGKWRARAGCSRHATQLLIKLLMRNNPLENKRYEVTADIVMDDSTRYRIGMMNTVKVYDKPNMNEVILENWAKNYVDCTNRNQHFVARVEKYRNGTWYRFKGLTAAAQSIDVEVCGRIPLKWTISQ